MKRDWQWQSESSRMMPISKLVFGQPTNGILFYLIELCWLWPTSARMIYCSKISIFVSIDAQGWCCCSYESSRISYNLCCHENQSLAAIFHTLGHLKAPKHFCVARRDTTRSQMIFLNSSSSSFEILHKSWNYLLIRFLWFQTRH